MAVCLAYGLIGGAASLRGWILTWRAAAIVNVPVPHKGEIYAGNCHGAVCICTRARKAQVAKPAAVKDVSAPLLCESYARGMICGRASHPYRRRRPSLCACPRSRLRRPLLLRRSSARDTGYLRLCLCAV